MTVTPRGLHAQYLYLQWDCKHSSYNSIGAASDMLTTPLELQAMCLQPQWWCKLKYHNTTGGGGGYANGL